MSGEIDPEVHELRKVQDDLDGCLDMDGAVTRGLGRMFDRLQKREEELWASISARLATQSADPSEYAMGSEATCPKCNTQFNVSFGMESVPDHVIEHEYRRRLATLEDER